MTAYYVVDEDTLKEFRRTANLKLLEEKCGKPFKSQASATKSANRMNSALRGMGAKHDAFTVLTYTI